MKDIENNSAGGERGLIQQTTLIGEPVKVNSQMIDITSVLLEMEVLTKFKVVKLLL